MFWLIFLWLYIDAYFSYLTERKILDGISLLVPAGKSVAIVGTSGSGKYHHDEILYFQSCCSKLFSAAYGRIFFFVPWLDIYPFSTITTDFYPFSHPNHKQSCDTVSLYFSLKFCLRLSLLFHLFLVTLLNPHWHCDCC